jgi:type II secretory pathway component PulK
MQSCNQIRTDECSQGGGNGVSDAAYLSSCAPTPHMSTTRRSDVSSQHQAEEHSIAKRKTMARVQCDNPSLIRISIDMLSGKTLTAVIDPLASVRDLKQRLSVRLFAVHFSNSPIKTSAPHGTASVVFAATHVCAKPGMH